MGEKVEINEETQKLIDTAVENAVKNIKPDPPKVDVPIVDPEEEKRGGFKTFGEYLTSVRRFRANRDMDKRLKWVGESKTAGHMEIGEDSQGGFLVPEIYRAELYELALETSIVRPRATIIPMTTDSLKIPFVNDTSHASNVYGGVVTYWTAEAAAKTPTKPTFGQIELTPHKLAGITYASNELMADSAIPLEPLIKRMFGTAMGYQEDDAFLLGTGAGQPLGILNAGCLISVFRNTVNRVHVEDLAEMWMHLRPECMPFSYWVINPTVIPELIELGSGNAADASGKLLIYVDKVQDEVVWKIFGRPVLISEKLQALGTAGDILLADFRQYLIGDRQPITIDASTHIAFTTDETCWRFVLRVAGMPWQQSAQTLRKGGITVSPFVQLAATTS